MFSQRFIPLKNIALAFAGFSIVFDLLTSFSLKPQQLS